MKKLFTDDYSELTEDERNSIKEELMDYLPEDEDITDDDIYQRFINDLEYECEDLKDILDKIDNEHIINDLIVIADLGLWDGHHKAYKLIDHLSDIDTCMQDYNTIYVERNDLKIQAIHHDGTNYMTVREFKDISDERKDHFLDKIYYGTVTQNDISKCTRSIGKTVYDNFYL